MKDCHIYLFKNIANLKKVVGYVTLKDQFVNGDFIKEAHVLLYLSHDLVDKKEVLFKKIQKHLISGHEYTIQEYKQKYATQIKHINEYLEIHDQKLSWLEIFQVATIICDEQINSSTIKVSIQKINQFKKDIYKLF